MDNEFEKGAEQFKRDIKSGKIKVTPDLIGRFAQISHVLVLGHFILNRNVKPVVLGKLQTLPGMLKVVNRRNLFIVYCSILYIILKVEIILYHCQN